VLIWYYVFFSSRRRHTRFSRDWSSDVCSSDLGTDASRAEHVAGQPDTDRVDPDAVDTHDPVAHLEPRGRGGAVVLDFRDPEEVRSEERRVGIESRCGCYAHRHIRHYHISPRHY